MFRNLLLASSAMVIALASVEAAYRVYLYHWHPYYFMDQSGLWYLQASPITYSEPFGFEYVPGTYQGGYVFDGQVLECWDPVTWWAINERGNSGRIRGSYEDASLKVLVFGDSFTQRPMPTLEGEWMTWPNYLQDALERELGESVHVVNFGRDGYGVLQMFDLAAAKIPEWDPDLAIFAFITDDLDRARFWRTNVTVGGAQRVLVSEVPDPSPSWDVATDAFLIEPDATAEWCRRLLESRERGDPVVRRLEERLVEGRRRSSVLASPWSLTQSFAFDMIVHGEPLHSTYSRTGPTQMPRHELERFDADPQAVARLEAIRATGVPIFVIHFASSGELEQGLELGGSGRILPRRAGLMDSLGDLTGQAVHRTMDYLDLSPEAREDLSAYYTRDGHPSLLGHELYAGVVAEALLSTGILTRQNR
jgi:hypothetical protein